MKPSYKNKKSVCIVLDGCKSNLLDSEIVGIKIKKGGYRIVNSVKSADIILFYSCAVSKTTEDHSISEIKRIQSVMKKDAELIVGGCLPEINPKLMSKYFSGRYFSPKKELMLVDEKELLDEVKSDVAKKDIITVLAHKFKKIIPYKTLRMVENLVFQNKNKLNKIPFFKNVEKYFRPSCIRIQKGCLGFCSYCAIKKARGELKSMPEKEILTKISDRINQGIKEIYLVGEDVGAYGVDIKTTFGILIKKIVSLPGDFSIRIGSFNPQWFVKYFDDITEASKSGKIKSINVSIQSGSSNILAAMQRPYNINTVISKLKLFQKNFPPIKIETHFIVGFPNESEDDFNKTMNLCKEIKFSIIQIFPFSARKDTKAATLPNQIPETDIKERKKRFQRFLKLNKNNEIIEPF